MCNVHLVFTQVFEYHLETQHVLKMTCKIWGARMNILSFTCPHIISSSLNKSHILKKEVIAYDITILHFDKWIFQYKLSTINSIMLITSKMYFDSSLLNEELTMQENGAYSLSFNNTQALIEKIMWFYKIISFTLNTTNMCHCKCLTITSVYVQKEELIIFCSNIIPQMHWLG